MSTKTMKILTMIASILLVVSIGATTVLGLTPSEINGEGVNTDMGDITDLGNKIVNALQTAGVVLSVVILIILGIKYMMGSAEEKADYKKTMIPYLIGALCIFIAPTIANVVFKIAQSAKA